MFKNATKEQPEQSIRVKGKREGKARQAKGKKKYQDFNFTKGT